MNLRPILIGSRTSRHLLARFAFLFISLWQAPLVNSAELNGSVAGVVSNAATGNLLVGATVEIPSLGLSTVTEFTGSYVLKVVPGNHEVVVSYTGLDVTRSRVQVTPGERVELNFDLTSGIYKLQEFVVSGEREGNAASITRQRNSPNVKSVVSMDAFGNLPNDSAGELLARLPGIAGRYDDEGNVSGVAIRGIDPGLNTVSIDGNQQASAAGFGRSFRTHNISGALFDEIEVVKAPTPDMPADALGGAINLKTRSPLSMKEKRRINYRAMARWTPPFFEHTGLRREHPIHPLLSLNYQEVFGVLGGERNLGVALSAFYSENVNAVENTTLDYQNTTANPAYVWDIRRQNAYNNRTQRSATLKIDYKLSDRTRVFVSTIYNDAPEKFQRLYTVRAFTTQAVAVIGANGQPTGNNAILPGYTVNRTEARPVAASSVELNSTLQAFLDRQRQFQAGAEHKFDRLKLDYDINYNHSKPALKNSERDGPGGGVFTMQASGIGFVFDKSASAVEPSYTQTGGPSIYNVASYTGGLLTNRNNERFTTMRNASANSSYDLPTPFTSNLKTGARFRDVRISETGGDRRWNYVGTTGLSAFVDNRVDLTFFDEMGGRLPFVETALLRRDIDENPRNWNEDRYYAAERTYLGTRSLNETISAGYVQGSARFGGLTLLGGVRIERTEVTGRGFIAERVRTTTAQRLADPVGAAARDYANNLTTIEGSYTDLFPGLHAVYRFLPQLQGRLSWSNSVGRPAGTNMIPSLSFSDTAQTVSISNPSLKPQYAENWDAALEYYFEPVGQLSVGVFRKNIKDFIIANLVGGVVPAGRDNGFEGDFAGYEIRTSRNGGFARVQGYELNYVQQFTFLPGLLRGLSFSANYTKLTSNGDYGATGTVATNQVANFLPENLNAVLGYSYRKFSTRIQYNYMGDYLVNTGTEARAQFRYARELVNLQFGYQWLRNLGFSVELVNVFNEPQQLYRGYKDRLSNSRSNGAVISFGISGTF